MVFDALEVEGATVLFLTGELDAASSASVRERVASLLDAGRRMLVLDLSGVKQLYTAGMLVLLESHRVAARRGGRLVCCGARPFIREILRITMLDEPLGLQMDVDSALDLLRAAS